MRTVIINTFCTPDGAAGASGFLGLGASGAPWGQRGMASPSRPVPPPQPGSRAGGGAAWDSPSLGHQALPWGWGRVTPGSCVSLQVGVRIRPGGRNQGQAQSKMVRQRLGDRDGPRPGRDISSRVRVCAWILDHGWAQARLQHQGCCSSRGQEPLPRPKSESVGRDRQAGAELQIMLHRSVVLISFLQTVA